MAKTNPWGKLLSFRIPKKIEPLLEQKNRSMLVEEMLVGTKGLCPLCEKKWPSNEEAMERIGVRLSSAVYEQVHQLPTAFVRAWILVRLGYCPVCQAQKLESKLKTK